MEKQMNLIDGEVPEFMIVSVTFGFDAKIVYLSYDDP